MGISAEARAATALRGTTMLPPERVIALIREVAARFVKTPGIPVRFHFKIVGDTDQTLNFSLTTGKNEVERCTFSASATKDGPGTQVRVGGLETYRTASNKLYGLIPTGPKEIEGMVPYKRFLGELQQQVQTEDPKAVLTIVQG